MRMLMISFAGQVLLNALLLWTIWQGTQTDSRWRKIAVWWVIIELLSFAVLVIVKAINYYRGEFLRGGTSLFTDYYVFIVILMTLLLPVYALVVILRNTGKCRDKCLRQRIRGWTLAIGFPLAILFCGIGYYSSKHPVVTHYNLTLPYKGEPKELTIALITDMHIGELITKKDIKKMVQMVQAETPDYVLTGGDQIDYLFDYIEEDPELTELIRSLHPDPSRIFHVLGNHEYYIDLEKKCKWLGANGVLLRDSVVQLQDSLYLIGRDDAYNKSRLPLEDLVKRVPKGATTIVLDHQPIEPKVERDLGINLALHGHTHDGQFIPNKWLLGITFENSYGHLYKGVTNYITSSGFGFSSSPILFGTLCEVVIIHLRLE